MEDFRYGMEMEWKKIASMEYGKIVFHSIPYHALVSSKCFFFVQRIMCVQYLIDWFLPFFELTLKMIACADYPWIVKLSSVKMSSVSRDFYDLNTLKLTYSITF